MSYLALMTSMCSEAKNPEHERHIYEMEAMVRMMINELVPPLVEKLTLDTLVKIQTQLNGKNVDFPDVRAYVEDKLRDEIQKAIKNISN